MTSEIMVEAIGFAAGALGYRMGPPNHPCLYKGEHEGISLLTLASILTTLALWVIYGLLIESLSLIISNAAAFCLIGLVFVGVIRLRYFDGMSSKGINSVPVSYNLYPKGVVMLFESLDSTIEIHLALLCWL